MSRLSLSISIALAALTLAARHPAQAQTSIQFQDNGVALAATQAAGVIPTTHYNILKGESGTSGFLLDNAGSGTTITATYSAPGHYYSLADYSSPTFGSPNNDLMSAYLDGDDINYPVVTISGLDAAKSYSVYAYFNSDHVGSSAGQSDRIAQYTIGTTTFTANLQPGSAFNANGANGGFIAAVGNSASPGVANYALFSNVVGPSFILSAQALTSGDQFRRASIDGLQIFTNEASAAPEPSQLAGLAFTGLGAFGLVLKARKRRSAVQA